jgi:pimeloyl-[acyl-carrier protein] methyl ester esterase
MTLSLYTEHRTPEHAHQDCLPLVLLHGWGMNLRVFDALRAGLSEECETRAIDLPGHGRSPWAEQRAGLESQLEDILGVLPARCMLLGWSLGGQFALELTQRAPQRIAGLVLIATTPRFRQTSEWPQGLTDKSVNTFQMMLAQDWRQTLSDFVWLQLRGSRNADVLQKQIESALHSHGMPQTHALALDLELMGVMDQRPLLASIVQPALVITGQNDRVTPPAAGQYLAARMQRARCVQIAQAGHAPFASHTQECLAAIRPFLRECQREVA